MNLIRSIVACSIFFTITSALQAGGFEPGKKYLIIHADDAGMSHSVNLATIEGMEKGIVSSCSIMVPCPWFPEFAEYARNHPDKDYGLHLTMNSEWRVYKWRPVAPLDKVPSLVDKNGYLWPDVPETALAAKAAEVEIELRAQIERAKEFKIPVSHLDTHMGTLFCRPDIAEVYVRLGLEYKLPILYPRVADERSLRLMPWIAVKGPQFLAMLEKEKYPILDDLLRFNLGKTHEERFASYIKDMQKLKPGFNQIIIHCGVANQELEGITGTYKNRDSDRRTFIDPKMIEEIKKQQIEVITWKQAWEMSHGK